jgi:hypothetical protein
MSTTTNHAATDRSLGELVSEATRELSTLFRTEVELAKLELRHEVSKAGKGAGLLGAAGVLAWFAVALLSAAIAFGLVELGLSAWQATLAVGIGYAVGAVILALLGKRRFATVQPPHRTIETLREDVAWARSRKS